MSVEFHDFRVQCKEALDDKAIAFLEEVGSELQTQASENTPVKTGHLAGKWDHVVDSSKKEVVIGNPVEYAIWVEMGTGEYALKSNGRKGGWSFKDDDGKEKRTYGRKPKRMLHNAFVRLKPAIIARAKQIFGDLD